MPDSNIIPKRELSAIEWIFANRGIKPENIDHYLHTTRQDVLNPRFLNNIQRGAEMFISHLLAGDKIFIQIDSDVDGYTSAAALINYSNSLAPGLTQQNISYRIHKGKQHGLILDTIPEDVKLVIAPDSSSNDYEIHQTLKEKGIDVLVLDHHEAEQISPYACVINNQLCDYPNKSLSGVGIVYKFCQYIDSLLPPEKRCANHLLDLVAVGCVADMMDLRNLETRELITEGINNLENPFINAFSEAQAYSLKGKLSPFGISFYIAPYINATIRVGSTDEKLLLFESMLDFRAYEEIPSTKRGCKGELETRVAQACRVCKNVKNRQTKLVDSSLLMINQLIEEKNLLNLPVIIIELNDPIDENLTGLIANKIMSIYMRPVLVLNHHITVDETTGEVLTDCWMGSGRNATYSKLNNFREFLADSGLVDFAQGHASAFGVSISNDKLPQLKDFIKQSLKDFDFTNSYRVDFIWKANEIDAYNDDIIEISKLNDIWGQGLQEPYIAIQNIKVHHDNLVLMSPDKKPTLKIILPNGLTLIKFKSSQEEFNSLSCEQGAITINIVGTCNLNEWNGNVSPQIFIEDYQIVNDIPNYYF